MLYEVYKSHRSPYHYAKNPELKMTHSTYFCGLCLTEWIVHTHICIYNPYNNEQDSSRLPTSLNPYKSFEFAKIDGYANLPSQDACYNTAQGYP